MQGAQLKKSYVMDAFIINKNKKTIDCLLYKNIVHMLGHFMVTLRQDLI